MPPSDAFELLSNDPAVVSADPDARRWLLAILAFGERAEGPAAERDRKTQRPASPPREAGRR
jgi:hypothetical protein